MRDERATFGVIRPDGAAPVAPLRDHAWGPVPPESRDLLRLGAIRDALRAHDVAPRDVTRMAGTAPDATAAIYGLRCASGAKSGAERRPSSRLYDLSYARPVMRLDPCAEPTVLFTRRSDGTVVRGGSRNERPGVRSASDAYPMRAARGRAARRCRSVSTTAVLGAAAA